MQPQFSYPAETLTNTFPCKGLTPNLTTAECNDLGFAVAIYPCTGFILAMLAMEDSYRGLKQEGSDFKYCKDDTIVNFFQ